MLSCESSTQTNSMNIYRGGLVKKSEHILHACISGTVEMGLELNSINYEVEKV